MMNWEPTTHYRWLPTEQELRQGLFIVAWPLRAALALLALTFGICVLPEIGPWEACKKDAKALLRFRLE